MRERVVLKEKSHLLASGPLQRSRQLKEPTKCSWVKAYGLAEPISSCTITFTGEAKVDNKITFTSQKCHKYHSKPYENASRWQVVGNKLLEVLKFS